MGCLFTASDMNYSGIERENGCSNVDLNIQLAGNFIKMDVSELTDPLFEPQIRARANTWPLRPKIEPLEASNSPGADETAVTQSGPKSELCQDVAVHCKKAPARKNAWGNLSYADLITKAIQSTIDKRLTLSQIYDWMVQNVPYFHDKGDTNSSAGWKNSIRHNLSLHNRFMRMPNEGGAGKSSWWVINPDAKPGKTPRQRRANSMETKTMEKKRHKVRKRIEAMRTQADQGSSPTRTTCAEDGFFTLSPIDMGPFRDRTSSNASTLSTGRLSPIPAFDKDTDDELTGWDSGNISYSSSQDCIPDNMVDSLMDSMRLVDGNLQLSSTPEESVLMSGVQSPYLDRSSGSGYYKQNNSGEFTEPPPPYPGTGVRVPQLGQSPPTSDLSYSNLSVNTCPSRDLYSDFSQQMLDNGGLIAEEEPILTHSYKSPNYRIHNSMQQHGSNTSPQPQQVVYLNNTSSPEQQQQQRQLSPQANLPQTSLSQSSLSQSALSPQQNRSPMRSPNNMNQAAHLQAQSSGTAVSTNSLLLKALTSRSPQQQQLSPNQQPLTSRSPQQQQLSPNQQPNAVYSAYGNQNGLNQSDISTYNVLQTIDQTSSSRSPSISPNPTPVPPQPANPQLTELLNRHTPPPQPPLSRNILTNGPDPFLPNLNNNNQVVPATSAPVLHSNNSSTSISSLNDIEVDTFEPVDDNEVAQVWRYELSMEGDLDFNFDQTTDSQHMVH